MRDAVGGKKGEGSEYVCALSPNQRNDSLNGLSCLCQVDYGLGDSVKKVIA